MTEPVEPTGTEPADTEPAGAGVAGQDSGAAAVPPEDADPQEAAEKAAGAEPEAVDTRPEPAWLIDVRNNAPAWIVAALEDLHTRLVELGG